MSGYRRVNYYELCRLCTSSEGSKMHIFREEGKRRQLSSKIQLCLPLQVNEEDSLPKIVCNNCVEKLESFFDFRSSCVNAEAMLEGYFTSLRYNNNDFTKEGKVYVKDVSPSKLQECETIKRIEVNNAQIAQQEIHVQLPTPSQVKVSSSQSQTVTSVPVTLDSLGSLVQAAAIQIVGQTEPEDNRLQEYKCAVQIQQGPVVESSTSESRFTFQSCTNTPITTTAVLKPVHTQQPYVSVGKNDKSSGEEERVEEESSEDGENETSLQPTIAFTSSNTGQDVLVHFGFNKEKEGATNVFQTDDNLNRGSVVQIGEFLRMKTVGIETSEEANVTTANVSNCEHCGKEVPEEEKDHHSLSCSALASSEEKPNVTYTCDICHKLFKRKEHLFQHKKLHTGERPYLCRDCGKAFSRKEHLVRHSVSHTGQKQYSCDICGKSFGRKDNVRKHRKTHGLSGPFVCETCGKTFVVKPYYLMHKASHCSGEPESGSFPYRCDICNKGFTVKHYLTTHKLRHRNKAASSSENASSEQPEPQLDLPTVQTAILPPNVLHQAQVFQVATATSPNTYICATTNQLLETYRKLNQT